jgi:uncharacterized protein (DUF342 family)
MQLLEEDRKKVHNSLVEASNSLTRIDAERDLIKNIINDTSKNFQIPKKTIKKLVRVYHKQNFSEEVATHEEFENLYETVTKTTS